MAELEEEDDFPNDFDGLNFDSIPGLQAPTVSTPDINLLPALPQNDATPTVASPVPSDESNGVEHMDPSFLDAIDVLEARALSEMARGSGSTSYAETDGPLSNAKNDALKTNSGSLKGEDTGSLCYICEPLLQSPESFSTNRKGKRKAETREDLDIRAVLAGYEAELTCPICCDLLVGAQVANPCGHTCCGECSHGWLARNKYEPICAVCRTSLSIQKPVFSNFSVDNLVQQHLQTLAKSGRPEWQDNGYKTIEWNKRLESWKRQTAARAASEKWKDTTRSRRRRTRTRYFEAGGYSYATTWTNDESMDDDDDVPRRRGPRSRR